MKLVFATHNQNKFWEVKVLLPAHIELLSLTDIECYDEIPETEVTLEGNAVLKAAYVKENYGLDCFADDTGLEVRALNGKPGVYSARYAGVENNSEANMMKLLKNLEGVEDRSAVFKTVIALSLKNEMQLFTGICDGRIISAQRGVNGFGYDPIFQPFGYSQTFAEITSEEKGTISHRGKAIQQLITYLLK
jgi:XTP/dITP diphosphohydrolase